jgi:hypothetical protein
MNVPVVNFSEKVRCTAVAAALLTTSLLAAEPLYTREGTDPPFAAVVETGGIKPGERFSQGPVPGSRIDVNNELLEKQTGQTGPIPTNIGIHTQGSGSIPRKDFEKWTRWYQEDDNTQVFRLFKDEQNVRDGIGMDGSPGRIESFSRSLIVAPGTWHEWEGTYTIIEPVGANIFQLMHEGHLWPFHIRMSDQGEIYFHRRRPVPGMEQRIVLAENMVGRSLSIKVRANGEEICHQRLLSKSHGQQDQLSLGYVLWLEKRPIRSQRRHDFRHRCHHPLRSSCHLDAPHLRIELAWMSACLLYPGASITPWFFT